MMTQDAAKSRIEKTIRNYRFMQETHMVSDYVSDSLDVRIDAGLVAMDAIDKLQEIKKIVDDWHTIRNIQDANDAMADYFNQILDVFKEYDQCEK